MTATRTRPGANIGVLIAIATATVACGHKGNPLPPDHPPPPPVSAFTIERAGPAVTLHFVVPGHTGDEHAPRLYDRVNVYAVSKAAAAIAPTVLEMSAAANLLSTVNAPQPSPQPESAPAPGGAPDTLAFTDTLAAAGADTSRYYAVQTVNGRRRGPVSPVLMVPLDTLLPAPANVVADYDERVLSVSWAPAGTGQKFVLDETEASGGGHATRLTAAPLDGPRFETPVAFGKARCFVVRAVLIHDAVTIVGDATAPVCVTPVDRFPPSAPSDLVALAGDAGVELSWSPSAAADVAGYIVLRGEGSNDTLQPLTPAPIGGRAYRDETARSGVTYQYAVKAVDGARNESGLSNRYVVTARGPGRDVAPAGKR